MRDEIFLQNASKLAIFYEYKNPNSLYTRASTVSCYKTNVAQNEKQKKTISVFVFQKYGKF